MPVRMIYFAPTLGSDLRDGVLHPGPDRIGRALAIFTYPTFYLIDRQGTIRARFVGGFDEKLIQAKVEQLLSQ